MSRLFPWYDSIWLSQYVAAKAYLADCHPLCSASSQWHHRASLARPRGSSFATVLMFHFIPRGMHDLVRPRNWARLFDVPALAQITSEIERTASAQLVRRGRR